MHANLTSLNEKEKIFTNEVENSPEFNQPDWELIYFKRFKGILFDEAITFYKDIKSTFGYFI